MICLSDSDIIYKLAACDLLDDAWAAFALSPSEIYVLPTAKHKFGLTKNLQKARERYGEIVLLRLSRFLGQVREIDFELSATDLQLLSGIDGIDAGEAVLYVAAAQLTDFMIATGDKVGLRALAGTKVCQSIAERLIGRVFCFEEIVRHIIHHFGFQQVRVRLAAGRACDTALRAMFGSGNDATESNVMDGLASYIDELHSLPVPLLARVPDWAYIPSSSDIHEKLGGVDE